MMGLQQIGATSGTYSKIKHGKRWQASFRVDRRQCPEEHGRGYVPVIHWRREGEAEQQSMLSPCGTQEEATRMAKRILRQLGYSREGAQ